MVNSLSGAAEALLIPAFVFFKQLYLRGSTRPRHRRCGGRLVLIADAALEGIGGVERIRGEPIDDCALATAA